MSPGRNGGIRIDVEGEGRGRLSFKRYRAGARGRHRRRITARTTLFAPKPGGSWKGFLIFSEARRRGDAHLRMGEGEKASGGRRQSPGETKTEAVITS